MPMMPFSLCRITSRPAGRWLAISVGRPMPRLTTLPSAMSWATRAAIWSRVQRGSVVESVMSGRLEARTAGRGARDGNDTLDEQALRHDGFGIERTELHHLVQGGDRACRGHRHDGAEVARRHAVGEVAPAVAAFGLDQGDVGVDGIFEHLHPAVDLARLLAFGQDGA